MESDRFEKPVRGLRKGLKKLSRDPAAEEVHKLRTKARDMEAVAGVLSEDDKTARRVLKAIKPVRKAAGGVRDLDVLTADLLSLREKTGQESLMRLVEALGAMRQENAAELVEVVERRRKRARRRLKGFARRLKEEFAEGGAGVGATRLEVSVRAAIEELTLKLRKWPTLSKQNIHGFRLKVKELRSLLQLEPGRNAAFVRALSGAKKQIGEWHDWQQLRETAGEILDARRDGDLLARITNVVEHRLKQALAASNALRKRYLRQGLQKLAA